SRARPCCVRAAAAAASERLASQTLPLAVACSGATAPTSGTIRIRWSGPSAFATNSTLPPSTTASCTSSPVSSARACKIGAQRPGRPDVVIDVIDSETGFPVYDIAAWLSSRLSHRTPRDARLRQGAQSLLLFIARSRSRERFDPCFDRVDAHPHRVTGGDAQ